MGILPSSRKQPGLLVVIPQDDVRLVVPNFAAFGAGGWEKRISGIGEPFPLEPTGDSNPFSRSNSIDSEGSFVLGKMDGVDPIRVGVYDVVEIGTRIVGSGSFRGKIEGFLPVEQSLLVGWDGCDRSVGTPRKYVVLKVLQ